MTRIKICCIASLEEAELAIRHGASALGLVSAMPSGPGVIPEERIAAIAAHVPPGVSSFLLTSELDVSAVIEQQRRCRVDTLQLCDALPDGAHRHLRNELPGVRIVQVIHVTGPEALEQATHVAPDVHAILLDSGNPGLAVKRLGGTGRLHDWTISRRIREAVSVPIYLAGGLNAENVGEAIRAVRPFGVDICSGVRTDGKLDETRLKAFVKAVGEAVL